VDEAGRDLPRGETGLVRLRAPGMAQGYIDDREAEARAFRDGWFQPGDRGRVEADGTLVFAGRDSEMMILGTINIFPAEIERAAEGFPGVADCAAFALPSGTLGDIPALAVVETAPGAVDIAALAAACRARLGLRAPRRVVVVAALPRTATGKVQRDRLAALGAG
jgi:acyl-CoA synthetase (AMP-forming)/AMP-acid ligase II